MCYTAHQGAKPCRLRNLRAIRSRRISIEVLSNHTDYNVVAFFVSFTQTYFLFIPIHRPEKPLNVSD